VMFLINATGLLRPRPRVALVTASSGQYWDLIIRGARDAAERHKVRLTVLTPKSDEPSQTAALQGLIGKGLDGVAVSPNDPPRQAAVLADLAAESDLVTFDSDSQVSRRLVFIGTDNYDAGRQCAHLIRSALPDGGEVVLCIGSLEKENGQRRRQGVIDELLGRSFEPNRPMDPVDPPLKGNQYTVAATLVDGIDADRATQLAADALKAHPNAKCFAGLFAYNGPSVLRALESAGQLGKVQVVAFDAYDQTLAGIENGAVYGTILQDPYSIGFESIRVLADNAKGDRRALPLFNQFHIACDSVTKANVAIVRDDLARKRAGAAGAPNVPGGAAVPTTTATTQRS
jgi:ribose transport system substrate-binding protein